MKIKNFEYEIGKWGFRFCMTFNESDLSFEFLNSLYEKIAKHWHKFNHENGLIEFRFDHDSECLVDIDVLMRMVNNKTECFLYHHHQNLIYDIWSFIFTHVEPIKWNSLNRWMKNFMN